MEPGDGEEWLRESDLDRHLGRADDQGQASNSIRKSAIEFPVDEILSVLDQAGLTGNAGNPEPAEEKAGD